MAIKHSERRALKKKMKQMLVSNMDDCRQHPRVWCQFCGGELSVRRTMGVFSKYEVTDEGEGKFSGGYTKGEVPEGNYRCPACGYAVRAKAESSKSEILINYENNGFFKERKKLSDFPEKKRKKYYKIHRGDVKFAKKLIRKTCLYKAVSSNKDW